jgi:hypothetical protein
MAEERSLPSWRRGWTWTLIKCGVATLVLAVAGTLALIAVLRNLLDRLPGWLPESWSRWLFEWILGHVWFVGPVIGVLVGLLVSAGIVVVDAKRGKLTRVR